MCCLMQALMTLLLPTNFFYIFLYYTDIGSLAFVLASLLVSFRCGAEFWFFAFMVTAQAVLQDHAYVHSLFRPLQDGEALCANWQ